MRYLLIPLFAASLASLASGESTPADSTETAYEELDWSTPTSELLEQQYCPLDSSADAMVVQKEMDFDFDLPKLNVTSRRRIKIYTSRGLNYSQFKEIYTSWDEIKSITAECYDTKGLRTDLSPSDIHDEIILKSEKKGWKVSAKSFAVPKVSPGCVIDVAIKSTYTGVLTPPVFRFHEDIPVAFARFRMKPPEWLTYTYAFTNGEMIKPKTYHHNSDFVCEAKNIRGIENEIYRLPERNLVTDLWIDLKGVKFSGFEVAFANEWSFLADVYAKSFKAAYENSGKARRLADSLSAISEDPHDRIRMAHHLVRDRWGDIKLFRVSGPSDDIDDLMKRKELDAQDKATVLWGILKHMGFEAEVVWICSDNSKYSPMPDIPTVRMFDYALTFIEADTLYLDPGDPGGDFGALDEAFSERLVFRPLASSHFLLKTRKIEKASGTMVDFQVVPDENDVFRGQGTVSFYGQAAIEARRIFKKEGIEEKKALLNHLLFREGKGTVESITPGPDSAQTAGQFQLTCDVSLSKFLESNEPNFDLEIYPGPTFDTTIVDYNPPRRYPIYFNAKCRNVYTIEWNFGSQYQPFNTEGLNLSVDGTLQSYKLLTEYDQSQNRLTVRRQHNRPVKLFDPEFTPTFERFLRNAQKCDLTAIMMVKR